MSDKVTREERLLEVLKILPYLRSKHPLYHEEFDAIRALIREHGPEVDENIRLRKLLWLRHGCSNHALYGDDGEMQCAKCLLDFKRMSVEEIEKRWESKAVNLLRQHLAMRKKNTGEAGVTVKE